MKQSFILWLGAFVIAFLFAFWNRVSSPEFPITGAAKINSANVRFKFDKVYRGNDAYNIVLGTEGDSLEGKILWKIKGDSEWNYSLMKRSGKSFSGRIPAQPPLTLIEYRVQLFKDNHTIYLPTSGNVTLKFYAQVPSSLMGFYLFTLYMALIFSVRTGLDYFNENQKIKKLSIFTVMIWFANVMVFNPVKRSYELSAKIGTKILPLPDLFDIPHVLLLLLWIAGTILLFNVKNFRFWSLVLAAITLILFLFVN